MEEIIKKINDQGFSSFIDHLLMTNMHIMSDMVITKRMVGKYEIYYKAHQGQDIDHMVIENNHFKEIISDLHKKIKDKNKEIVELKVVVAYLNQQII